MAKFAPLLLLGAVADEKRILFIGNSFTYVNDLPQQVANVAASFGDSAVVEKSVIGGCTLYHQEADTDDTTAKLLEQEWDYIVLQDYSALPTVKKARDQYLHPAVKDFVGRKKDAKIVMYLTWAYHDGIDGQCPSSDNAVCFPLGKLPDLTDPSCESSTQYQDSVTDFECMGYSLARGYLSALEEDGADMSAPCGLAWQIVRGSETIPEACKALTDSEYDTPLGLDLPFSVDGGAQPDLMLNRVYSTGIDKHPNVAGQYLNALTFYSTLFGKSPVGAAPPSVPLDPSAGDRDLTAAEVLSLQKAAEAAVAQCGSVCGLSSSSDVTSVVV